VNIDPFLITDGLFILIGLFYKSRAGFVIVYGLSYSSRMSGGKLAKIHFGALEQGP